jgi:hypothetical protein
MRARERKFYKQIVQRLNSFQKTIFHILQTRSSVLKHFAIYNDVVLLNS